MNINELKTKLRAIHSLLNMILFPRSPSGPTVTELAEQAEELIGKLEAELVLQPVEFEVDGNDKSLVRAQAGDGGGVAMRAAAPATAATLIPDFDKQLVESLRIGFGANVSLWNGKAQTFDERPDAKTRLETAKVYLAYRLGMPTQMRLNIDAVGFKDRHAEMLAMAKTPSGRETLLRIGAIDEEWLAKNMTDDSQK